MKALIIQVIFVLFTGREVPVTQVIRHSTAIEHVVDTEPLPFQGKNAKERSAILLAALAEHESGFREEIEMCNWRGIPGMSEDDGKSKGLTQLYKGASRGGYAEDEICGNAELQFRLALRYLTMSMRKCKTMRGMLSNYNRNMCLPSIYSERVGNRYERLVRYFL